MGASATKSRGLLALSAGNSLPLLSKRLLTEKEKKNPLGKHFSENHRFSIRINVFPNCFLKVTVSASQIRIARFVLSYHKNVCRNSFLQKLLFVVGPSKLMPEAGGATPRSQGATAQSTANPASGRSASRPQPNPSLEPQWHAVRAAPRKGGLA